MTLPAAPLLLDSYYYTNLEARFLPDPWMEGRREISLRDVDCDFGVSEIEADQSQLVAKLQVSSLEDSVKSGLIPIQFKIEVLGRFFFTPELREKLVQDKFYKEKIVSNSLSILYGSVRDQFFSMTAKMPCGAVFLPTRLFPIQTASAPEGAQELSTPKSSRRSRKKASENE